MKNLYTWQGKLYGVLFDADAQILYYRKDVLSNPEFQEKFKAKLGYDLPNPPKDSEGDARCGNILHGLGLER